MRCKRRSHARMAHLSGAPMLPCQIDAARARRVCCARHLPDAGGAPGSAIEGVCALVATRRKPRAGARPAPPPPAGPAGAGKGHHRGQRPAGGAARADPRGCPHQRAAPRGPVGSLAAGAAEVAARVRPRYSLARRDLAAACLVRYQLPSIVYSLSPCSVLLQRSPRAAAPARSHGAPPGAIGSDQAAVPPPRPHPHTQAPSAARSAQSAPTGRSAAHPIR